MAAHGNRLEIAGESWLALPVDNQISSQAIRQPLRFSHKILPDIQDHLVRTRCTRGLSLFFGRDSTDDTRSEMLGPLHEQQTQPACRSMNQHCVAGFERAVFMDKIVG